MTNVVMTVKKLSVGLCTIQCFCYFSKIDSNTSKASKIYPLPHMYVVKDLVPVSMTNNIIQIWCIYVDRFIFIYSLNNWYWACASFTNRPMLYGFFSYKFIVWFCRTWITFTPSTNSLSHTWRRRASRKRITENSPIYSHLMTELNWWVKFSPWKQRCGREHHVQRL